MRRGRFLHIEKRRPEREEEPPRTGGRDRFARLAEREAVTCIQCGAVLPNPQAVCSRCAPEEPRRNGRFETIAAGPPPPDAHLPNRSREETIAATVPAWRGEAFPEEVATEIRAKLGGATPASDPAGQRREEALAWADRQLRHMRDDPWRILGAGILAHFAIRRVLELVVPLGVLVFLLLWKACR